MFVNVDCLGAVSQHVHVYNYIYEIGTILTIPNDRSCYELSNDVLYFPVSQLFPEIL